MFEKIIARALEMRGARATSRRANGRGKQPREDESGRRARRRPPQTAPGRPRRRAHGREAPSDSQANGRDAKRTATRDAALRPSYDARTSQRASAVAAAAARSARSRRRTTGGGDRGARSPCTRTRPSTGFDRPVEIAELERLLVLGRVAQQAFARRPAGVGDDDVHRPIDGARHPARRVGGGEAAPSRGLRSAGSRSG